MIDDRYMALGDWELKLRPEAPQSVLDGLGPFKELVVMPGRVPVESMSDTAVSDALFRGPMMRFKKNRRDGWTIGGHSQAMWLGTENRIFGQGSSLPAFVFVAAGGVVDDWFASAADQCGLTLGTVTDPSGARVTAAPQQWVSWRENLDMLAKVYDIEWRINSDGTLDGGQYTALWPAPTVVLTPRPAARETGYVGLESLVDVDQDWWHYASKVYVMGRGAVAEAGGISAYRMPDGQLAYIYAMVDGADLNTDDTQFAANRVITQFTGAQQVITVSSTRYAIEGDLRPGARVYAYDPEAGVYDETFGTSIDWRGETIYPKTFRCLGVRWPVEDGMGVYHRYKTSGGSAATYTDLSDYVVWESGATDVTVGWDVSVGWNLHRGGLYKL